MHVISHRLEKSYFVSERAAYDLRSDFDLKKRVRRKDVHVFNVNIAGYKSREGFDQKD